MKHNQQGENSILPIGPRCQFAEADISPFTYMIQIK